MPTQTFTVQTGNDYEGYGNTPSSGSPSYAAVSYNSTFGPLSQGTASTVLQVLRSFTGATYEVAVALLRWDTSSLPDDAIVTSAQLKLYLNFSHENHDAGRALTAEWYDWGATAGSEDYATVAGASAHAGTALSSLAYGGSATNFVSNSFALANLSNVSLTGTTHLRLHVSGGQPSGFNYLTFAGSNNTAGGVGAQLVVTYTQPVSPTADFSFTTSGLTAAFTDNSTDPQNDITSRSWAFGDGATSTATNPSHAYGSYGTYDVTLTVTDAGGNANAVTKAVTVSPPANVPPAADFSFVTDGYTATFTDLSSDPDGTIVSRSWAFGDGATSTATNPVYVYASPGTYAVTVTVTDDRGASASKSRYVTVSTPTVETAGVASGYLLRHAFAQKTTLAGGVSAADAELPLSDLTRWPTSGAVLVGGEGAGGEKMTYNGKSAPNGAGSLLGLARGQFGTSAATHAAGEEAGLLGRRDGALSTKRMVPTFPVNGSITLQSLRRHEDGSRFAWADFDNYNEYVQLEVTGAPFAAGNMSTTLDEGGVAVTRSTAVSAAHESVSLAVDNAQSAVGQVTVTLDGVAKPIALHGLTPARHQITFDALMFGTDATLSIAAYDASNTRVDYSVELRAGDRGDAVAYRVRQMSVSGWTLGGAGNTVVATATTPGPRGEGNPTSWRQRGFAATPSWTDGRLAYFRSDNTAFDRGTPGLSAAQVAAQLREERYPGWTTSGAGSSVTWTRDVPGNLLGAHQYNPNATGATSAAGMQTTNGSRDTPAQVAAAVRATYGGNAYWTVGGSGALVTWAASSSGSKSDATWNPAATGLDAVMRTVNQGSSDVVAFVKDSAGEVQKHRVLANVATTTIFNIETAVSGAGTERGIVSFWGSFGADPKVLIRRFEELDLTQYALGQFAYGVTGESSDNLTWEVRTDEVLVTDRGETYHRDHNSVGELIRHGYGYFDLGVEQATSDAFVQELRRPVRPGQQITVGAYVRWDGVPPSLPAKPLYVTLRHADGTATEVGDVTGAGGISGSGGWQHFARTFTVPDAAPKVHEFWVASRDVSSGEIVFQELAYSVGASVKRTRLYAPTGVVRATYEVAARLPVDYLSLGRRRTELEAPYAPEPDAVVSVRYRAAQNAGSLVGATWYADPSLLPDLPAVDVEVTMNGDGLSTPRLLATYPRLEYEVLVGLKAHPVLLTARREELAGGVLLAKYEEWYPDTGVAPRILPSGRIRRQKTHGPVGYVPAISFLVVRPEAMRYVQENWGTAEFVVEAYGEALTLKLAAKPEFSRQVPPTKGPGGDRRGYWLSKEVPAEVTAVIATTGSP